MPLLLLCAHGVSSEQTYAFHFIHAYIPYTLHSSHTTSAILDTQSEIHSTEKYFTTLSGCAKQSNSETALCFPASSRTQPSRAAHSWASRAARSSPTRRPRCASRPAAGRSHLVPRIAGPLGLREAVQLGNRAVLPGQQLLQY